MTVNSDEMSGSSAGMSDARVARRYGNDVGAARAAAQKAVDEAAVVDAATRSALAALV